MQLISLKCNINHKCTTIIKVVIVYLINKVADQGQLQIN